MDRPASKAPRPALIVTTGAAQTVVGPLVNDAPGCYTCFATRRRLARPNNAAKDADERRWMESDQRPQPLLDVIAMHTLTTIIKLEIDDSTITPYQRSVVIFDHWNLTASRHLFLIDPLCPECSDLPEDTAEAGTLSLQTRIKSRPDQYRLSAAVEKLDQLRSTYVDSETGLIHAVRRDNQGGLAISAALMKLRRHDWVEPGFGRSMNYDESEATAILEALERYGGVQPGARRTAIVGSYDALQPDAVDPRLFGVHPEDTYTSGAYPYRRFQRDLECAWVWAFSFAANGPVLVPESTAYYYVAHDSQQLPFTSEVSNGCALGGSIEEAILFGLLEVVERDAFLLTWYAQLPIPELDLTSAADQSLRIQASLLEQETGYIIRLFDQTTENGIPTVWAMAEDARSSLTDTVRPARVCAAGAHLNLERAALSAISELGPFLKDFISRFPTNAERALAMARDSTLVRNMEDHATVYGSAEASSRFAFLSESQMSSFSERSKLHVEIASSDLRDDVYDFVERLDRCGQDVIVVDQTTDEHRAAGLSCVKVLVTGSLTMTFGHALRRTENIDRLLSVPALLGYREKPLDQADINPFPHPFP
ncbi:TOMM precursor leader peptide-binding protein [Cryobacterium sp. N21]|uniref:TOMM precursor leader peptide-binding protein n=1 Tax=Cryobacterium sp. N21 TaxID=2048289 RepID=UPI001124D12E|nr:TOMM precursor leader peptide-binding protein [Cryobacterium sp. N21]